MGVPPPAPIVGKAAAFSDSMPHRQLDTDDEQEDEQDWEGDTKDVEKAGIQY